MFYTTIPPLFKLFVTLVLNKKMLPLCFSSHHANIFNIFIFLCMWCWQEGFGPGQLHLSYAAEQHEGKGLEEGNQLPPQKDPVSARTTPEGR